MTESNKLGFYGKIPTNGDFVSRHLPRTFIDPWDQWLQEGIASSREQLGNQWLDSYLTGPIWRFALSRGVCGDTAWTGLVMPSVDRVGRYFPLTLATSVTESYKLLDIADKEDSWFTQAEGIALSALDQNNNLDSFNQDLEQLGVPEAFYENAEAQPDKTPTLKTINRNTWRIAMIESETITDNLSSLMELFIQRGFPDFTLWWTIGSDKVEPSILICKKLPPTPGVSALLTGNWDDCGWDNKPIIKPLIPIDDDDDDNQISTSTTS